MHVVVIDIYIIIRVHSAFSLVASCVSSTHARMTSTDGVIQFLAKLFCGSSHDFCQLYYKQINFIILCFCTVINHR